MKIRNLIQKGDTRIMHSNQMVTTTLHNTKYSLKMRLTGCDSYNHFSTKRMSVIAWLKYGEVISNAVNPFVNVLSKQHKIQFRHIGWMALSERSEREFVFTFRWNNYLQCSLSYLFCRAERKERKKTNQ